MAAKRRSGGKSAPSGTKAAAASAKEGRKGSVASKGSGRAAQSSSKASTSKASTSKANKGAAKTKEPAAEAQPDSQGMNREMKRMMKKREGAADRLRKPPTVSKKQRTKPKAFIREVRGELGRVAWPTRQEVITYTSVVLVTVAFFMTIIYAIDYVALNGVLYLIERGGR